MNDESRDAFMRTVAYLFRRSGRDEMSESEIWRTLSFELNWFPPKDARRLAEGLPRTGMVTRTDDGGLAPRFNVEAVKVPLDFRPPSDLPDQVPAEGSMAAPPDVSAHDAAASAPSRTAHTRTSSRPEPPSEEEEAAIAADVARSMDVDDEDVSPMQLLLKGVSEASGEGIPVWVERMNRTVQATDDLLTPEAALIVAAAAAGVDVSPWVGPVRDGLVKAA